MKISQLWNDKNGNFTHAKFWSSVAYAIMSYGMIKASQAGAMTGEIMMAYGAIVGGAEVAKKALTMKYEAKGE